MESQNPGTARNAAAVSGKRARRYLQRQHQMALGATALSYLTEIVHRRPHVRVRDVEPLQALLQAHGDDAVRAAFARGLAEHAVSRRPC